MAPGQIQPEPLARPPDERLGGVPVHGLGRLAHQPEQHRSIGGMAAPGQGQRSIQMNLELDHTLQAAAAFEILHEAQRDTHRPHGMRAGRPDTHAEQVEDADRHDGYFSGENAAGLRNTLS